MENKNEARKKIILEWLLKLGRTPTSKFVGLLGINYDYIKPLLEELEKENEITKVEETRGTYWELKEGVKDGRE